MPFDLKSPGTTSSCTMNTVNRSKYIKSLNSIDKQLVKLQVEILQQTDKLNDLLEDLKKGVFIQLIGTYPLGTPVLPEPSSLSPGSFFLITSQVSIEGVTYEAGDLALAVPEENRYVKVDRQALVVGTDLSLPSSGQTNNSLFLNSNTGQGVTFTSATEEVAGLMSGSSFSKLLSIEEGAEVNENTNLGIEILPNRVNISSSTGTGVTLPESNLTNSGVMSNVDKAKLNSIEEGATKETNISIDQTAERVYVNSSNGEDGEILAALTNRAGIMTGQDKSQLETVIADVTTIQNLRGQPSGYASLNENGKIPLDELQITELNFRGEYNVPTNSPVDLVTSVPVGTTKGDFWLITQGGNAQLFGMASSVEWLIGYHAVYDGTKILRLQTETVGTNLSISDNTPSSLSIKSSTGNDVTISGTTDTNAGLFTSSYKIKLDGISDDATKETNLSTTLNTVEVVINSDTGTNATVPSATVTDAGVLSANDKIKLDSIQQGAEVNVNTDLGITTSASDATITSSTGNNVTIPAANTSQAGLLTSSDKSKLNSVANGAQVNVNTNLAITTSNTTATISSSTGNNAIMPAATTSDAGLLTSSDKTKLNGIANGAEVNLPTNLGVTTTTTTATVSSSTGDDAIIPAATTSDAGLLSSSDKGKLNGIASGAQVNLPTNLGITTTTTTATVTSSTGNDVVIPGATTSKAGLLSSADKTTLNGLSGSSIPVGVILPYGGSSTPSGWLLCNGSSISSSYSVLRSIYGNNTPDLRGRFLGGAGGTGLNVLRTMYGQLTARPTVPFKSTRSIPNGGTRTFGAAGSKNAYSDAASQVTIDLGGDAYTRPPTYAINWIVKHD